MIAALAFEGLQKENQNCCPQETYLGYVTFRGLSFGAKLGA